MIKTWPVIIKDFLIDRTLEFDDKLLCRDREHARLKAEFSQALDQLIAGLDPKAQKLFRNYEKAETAMGNRKDEIFYQQGLIDGLRLGYLIDRLRRKSW